MNWQEAEDYLYEMETAYKEIGFSGVFGLTFTINPIINRFEKGERTQELYDEIMNIG